MKKKKNIIIYILEKINVDSFKWNLRIEINEKYFKVGYIY